MNKNKVLGFTLVELLAVIVVIAIIAFIIVPVVLSLIDDSKQKTSFINVNLFLEEVDSAILNASLDGRTIKNSSHIIMPNGNICIGTIKDNKCTDELKIRITGDLPSGGKVTIVDGEVQDFQLTYEDKTVINIDDKLVYAYKENSNIEVPDLYNGTLTPVVYDGDNWRIADVSSKWYDYSKQEWANAVILDSNVTKKVGDIVTVEGESPDVLAMLVWIPRYEYKIDGTYGKGGTSAALPGEIEVNFIPLSQKEASTDYRVHLAFTFGDAEKSGIWVGKFETSHITLSSKSTGNNLGCTNEQCDSSDGIRILPNVSSLRRNDISNFFYAIRSMSKEGNTFEIDKNITDTHMMKNNEWGAVAYLTQSKYGKYGNSVYFGPDKEVYINNSSGFITGRSGGSYSGNTAENTVYDVETDALYVNVGYYTYDGYLLEYKSNKKTEERDMIKVASTTGNIYGVYDMSGGAWEYVMGVFANSDGALWSGNSVENNSGFKGKVGTDGTLIEGLEWPNTKYYQIYKANSGVTLSRTKACNGGICYGDALKETANWYGDYPYFVSATNPWFIRGGYYNNGSGTGMFNSNIYYGNASGNGSVRVVFTTIT